MPATSCINSDWQTSVGRTWIKANCSREGHEEHEENIEHLLLSFVVFVHFVVDLMDHAAIFQVNYLMGEFCQQVFLVRNHAYGKILLAIQIGRPEQGYAHGKFKERV